MSFLKSEEVANPEPQARPAYLGQEMLEPSTTGTLQWRSRTLLKAECDSCRAKHFLGSLHFDEFYFQECHLFSQQGIRGDTPLTGRERKSNRGGVYQEQSPQ